MRHVTPLIALLLSATSAFAADTDSKISAGEHDGFSRIAIGRGAESAALVRNGRRLLVVGVDTRETFDLSEINGYQKAHRVNSARIITTPEGRSLELNINCDCDVQTSRLADGRFVIDVVAPGKTAAKKTQAKKPQPKTAEKSSDLIDGVDTMSVQQAHSRMIALLKEAARDGLIDIREDKVAKAPAPAKKAKETPQPKKVAAKEQSAPDKAPDEPAATPEPAKAPEKKTAQAADENAQELRRSCSSKHAFKIDGAAFEDEPMVKIAELQAELAEASDNAKQDIAHKLAAGFLSVGFGEEALALLTDYGKETSVYAGIAKIIAERPLETTDLLYGTPPCRGAQALWQAAVAKPNDAVGHYRRSENTIVDLPSRLRVLIAARIAMKMVDAKAWDAAQELYDIAVATEMPMGPELKYVKAMLDEQEGGSETSRDTLIEIASDNSRAADDALLALADTYVRNAETPHEGYSEDIGALAKTTNSAEAIMAEAMSWADLGNVGTALFLLQSLTDKSPEEKQAAQISAHNILSKALTASDPIVIYSALDAYLVHKSWFPKNQPFSELRNAAARRAFDVGLPNLALSVINEGGADVTGQNALLKARAALSSGQPQKAIEIAAPNMGDPAFAKIVVDANIALQKHHDALGAASTLQGDAAKPDLAARAAWLARSFKSAAKNFHEMDPNQVTPAGALNFALAAYMNAEKDLPAGARAILSQSNDALAKGAEALFAKPPEGTTLQRSKQLVDRTGAEIRMVEEVMNDG